MVNFTNEKTPRWTGYKVRGYSEKWFNYYECRDMMENDW